MSDKAIILKDDEIPEIAPHYGSRQDMITLGKRIKALMPGGQNLTLDEAMTAAEAAILSDANLFRGDIYVYKYNGQLIVSDGYKLLVREAKRQSDYAEMFFDLTPEERTEHNIGKDDIAIWVYILRDDRRRFYQQTLQDAKEFGLNFQEARREALEAEATKALGIVAKKDMSHNPPNTMTWQDVAKKRGLKHALRRAYALPSPREIAQRSWIVSNTETIEADWSQSESYRTVAERERAAQVAAWERERQEQWAEMTEDDQAAKVAHNIEAMRGTNGDDDDPLDLSPDPLEATTEVSPDSEDTKEAPQPETEPPKAKSDNGGKGKLSDDISTQFWLYAQEKKIDRQAALGIISEFGGDMIKAFEKLQDSPELIPPDGA